MLGYELLMNCFFVNFPPQRGYGHSCDRVTVILSLLSRHSKIRGTFITIYS